MKSSLLILIILALGETILSATPKSQLLPQLYNGPRITKCKTDSPEIFYRIVAQPALDNLNEETHGFFGILMDKLEESTAELDPEEEERLEKQWLYIMETIQDSLDNAMEHIKKSWALLVAVSHTIPLPWEVYIQDVLLKELVNNLEVQYVMVGAVVKAGVKEIVGTLQHQVGNAIKRLEKHVSSMGGNDDISELEMLAKIEQSFQQVDSEEGSEFINKLLRRLVKRAIAGRLPVKSSPPLKMFFSNMMAETAIAFEAYKQKGYLFPKFWKEMSEITKRDMEPRDLSSFLHHFNSNSELFVENVFAILVSSIPNTC